VKKLKAILLGMTEKVAFQLRKKQKLTGCVTVKLRYSNFDTVTRQVTIPYTSNDRVLIEKAMELFEKLYERRMLIRLIGVRLGHLIHGNYQINLFEDAEKNIKLYQSIDRMKRKYGSGSIVRAKGLGEYRRKEMTNSFGRG
jgi:DNA polymerase IV